MAWASRRRRRLRPESGNLLLLIGVTTLARLALGWGLPLGIDESYMVVAGRGAYALGYFDHPPLSWWMCRIAADLAGSEAAIVVRLPFIALFALSSWLMARLGTALSGPKAGFWAAVAFNLAPVFGVTSGGWVLPDGPLDAALLGAACCLLPALQTGAWRWWLGVGLCFGLAMLSKYTAALNGLGLVLFLLATPRHRRWFVRPQLYLAGAVAALVFSPVIAWNAANGFASLAFQSGRAAAAALHPFGPLLVLAGEALFLLPWIWAGLMVMLWQGLCARDERARLLGFMATPAIVLFCVVALWSRQVLFHWAAPGYLMLFPLLGAWLAQRSWASNAAWASAGFVASLGVLACVLIRMPVTLPKDALLQARNWTPLRAAVAGRDVPVAAMSWADAGKLGIGIGHAHEIVVLNTDARQFHFRPKPQPGSDVLVIAPKRSLAQMQYLTGSVFNSIEELRRVTVSDTEFGVFLGHGVKDWPG